jgi:ribosomal-protein-alanine N-acetyltransferase
MLTRHARIDDVPRLMQIERNAAMAAHWTERDYNAIFTEATPRRMAWVVELERREALAPEAGHPVQETPEAGVCGFIVVRCFEGEWEIENVAVTPTARQRGLATRLLEALLGVARQEQAVRIHLEVRESNLPARKLYEKLGFHGAGWRRNYYSNPSEDALLLELSLG